jgi:hypothetical protein
MSSIFGGSKQKSTQQSTSNQVSYNQAYPWAQQTYQPQVEQGNKASSSIMALLGLGGDKAAADGAYNDYLGSTGYQNTLATGSQAITNNAAARGLLGSGSTLKRLTQFGQANSQQYFGDYISKLLGMTQNGQNAGQIVTGAGNYSTGNSQSTGSSSGSSNSGGLGKFIGSALSAAAMASDPRLKTDVRYVGENEGLSVYDYRYTWDEPGTIRRGYMADEVAKVRPDALGPELPGGYLTLNYNLLPEIK